MTVLSVSFQGADYILICSVLLEYTGYAVSRVDLSHTIALDSPFFLGIAMDSNPAAVNPISLTRDQTQPPWTQT